MNNLDKILEKMQESASAEIAAAEKQCAERLAEINEQRQHMLEELTDAGNMRIEKELASIQARSKASASMMAREVLLAKKAALLETVYAKAAEAVYQLPANTYVSFLAGLAARAVVDRVQDLRRLREEYRDSAFAEEETYVLLLSEKDRETYGAAVFAEAKAGIEKALGSVPAFVLSEENAAIHGGVVVRYGDTQSGCTIAELMEALRERDNMDARVAAVLFS